MHAKRRYDYGAFDVYAAVMTRPPRIMSAALVCVTKMLMPIMPPPRLMLRRRLRLFYAAGAHALVCCRLR